MSEPPLAIDPQPAIGATGAAKTGIYTRGIPKRGTLILLIAILVAHLLLLTHGVLSKSICYDEGAHVAAGLAYLSDGETSIYNLSPPLIRLWAALPVLARNPEIPDGRSVLHYPPKSRHWEYYDRFQNENLPRLHALVTTARWMLLPFSLLTAVVIFMWARALFGDGAGLVSAAAWAFSPTVIDLGSTIGTDIPLTFFSLSCAGAWILFLKKPTAARCLVFAMLIAAAHGTKFSALLLWPSLIAIWLVLRPRVVAGVGQTIAALLIGGVVSYVGVNALHGFRLVGEPLGAFEFQSETMLALQRKLPSGLPVPFARYLVEGFDAQKWEAEDVYPATLFDEAFFGSDWRYYPLLALCKSTLGGLLLFSLALGSVGGRRLSRDEFALLALAITFGLGMFLLARICSGMRYLLPLYPVVIILIGRLWTFRSLRVAVLIGLAAGALETIAASPRLHSFYNVIARPYRFQVPDLEWGQGMCDVRRWSLQHPDRSLAVFNTSSTFVEAYGLKAGDARDPWATDYFAITAIHLSGLPSKTRDLFLLCRPWRKLREMQPAADFGGVLIYSAADVRTACGEDPFAIVGSWEEAAAYPEMAPIRNLDARRRKGQ